MKDTGEKETVIFIPAEIKASIEEIAMFIIRQDLKAGPVHFVPGFQE